MIEVKETATLSRIDSLSQVLDSLLQKDKMPHDRSFSDVIKSIEKEW